MLENSWINFDVSVLNFYYYITQTLTIVTNYLINLIYLSRADIYSQISDSNGHMIHWRFSEYLKEVLSLTAAVYESPSFGYSEGLANSIFPQVSSLK